MKNEKIRFEIHDESCSFRVIYSTLNINVFASFEYASVKREDIILDRGLRSRLILFFSFLVARETVEKYFFNVRVELLS